MCEYGWWWCEWVEGGDVENMWAGREWEGLTDGTPCLGNSLSAAGCMCVSSKGNQIIEIPLNATNKYGTLPLSLPLPMFTIDRSTFFTSILYCYENLLGNRDTAQSFTTVSCIQFIDASKTCAVHCPAANSWCLANNCLSYYYRIAEAITCSDGQSNQRHSV